MTKILVTGAGGYIGSTLCEMLLEKGYSVVALDKFLFGSDFIKDLESKMTVVKSDIRNVEQSVFAGVDGVCDLASLSAESFSDEYDLARFEINNLARSRIALLAKKEKVKRYVLASSCSVYGLQKETVNEESIINPLTMYAACCRLAEQNTAVLSDKYFATSALRESTNYGLKDFCATSLRQATVYGLSRKMRFELAINSMTLSAFRDNKMMIGGDGTQLRPFIHVRDTAGAFIKVLESEPELVNNQIYNVGSNEQNYTMLQLAEIVSKTLGREIPLEFVGKKDMRSYAVDFTKIKSIGYSTKYTVADGVKELYKAMTTFKEEMDANPALSNGFYNDPRTQTKKWYDHVKDEIL